MSQLLGAFAPTIPAGTPIAAPVLINMPIVVGTVDTIEIRIPPGPNGVMGFALAAAGQPIIPFNAAAWIIGNDDRLSWSLTDQIESGAWQLRGYNTGIYDHTVYVRFLQSVGAGSAGPANTQLIPAADISQPALTGADA